MTCYTIRESDISPRIQMSSVVKLSRIAVLKAKIGQFYRTEGEIVADTELQTVKDAKNPL